MIKMMADKSIYMSSDSNGKSHYRAQLIADTAAELAGVTEQDGVVWDFGSIAHAIDDAQILRLDSNSDWVIQTGDDAGKTPAEVASSKAALSAPKTALAKAIEDEWSDEIEGNGTGEAFPEVEKTAYPDDVEPLEPVETVDTETKKAVNADDRFE